MTYSWTKLKTSGISNKITNIIFHDVDVLPDINMIKNYIMPIKEVSQYATKNTFKKYNYDNFFGAVNGFQLNAYFKINGYPNSFWGWGGEDDATIKRIFIEM